MPPPHLGSLPHYQALLAAFLGLSSVGQGWLDAQPKRNPYDSLQKGLAWRVLTNMERTAPICLLVSRIHQVGAKGKAEVVVSRQS